MSAWKQLLIATMLFVGAAILFTVLAVQFHGIWAMGFMVAALAYGIWTYAFACPKCSTPYLVEMKGVVAYPRRLPRKCRVCGHPVTE